VTPMRMVADLRQTMRVVLPHGSPLDEDVWERRHRGIVVLLWVHAVGTAVFGMVRGVAPWHSVLESSILAVCAIAAAQKSGGRRLRACAAVFGLITASALLVHLSGGTIEMHFHFFVMVGLITLYQDWVPFGVALGYVVLHHGVLGYLMPTTVFSHPAAQRAPVVWALIHGAFVLAACAANLATWRLSELQANEISRLVSRLEGLARTDPLTGIPNRRVWDEEVPNELERARRSASPLCVAMLDLDHFKVFNDHHGHQAGDRALKEVASAWQGAVRTTDLLARYGGEEFGLLLPACSMDDAIDVVKRVMAATPDDVTVSIGVASWDFHESAEDLVRRADEALYHAKADGRDRYVTASVPA
jgi:diguanylate cyclase (GGDEF)-like protein